MFGLPIGEQRMERSVEGAFSTQWFERERFEAHPENRAPYDVLLGRLGDEQLRRQGRDWQTFPKGQPQPGCQFFETTGHSVCEPFLGYWRTHGLEFDGRAGTSYEESLALFGLPLSEPQPETNSSGDTVRDVSGSSAPASSSTRTTPTPTRCCWAAWAPRSSTRPAAAARPTIG